MQPQLRAPSALLRSRPTLRGVLDRLATLNARHRDRTHLAELDDRMLRDIGLSRADVAEELRRPIRW